MEGFNVAWDSGKQKGSNNLLTDENLQTVGFDRSQIKAVILFFAFPGTLYTEEGVAGSNHPCCGSAGINIVTTDGERASIQDIFYHDRGHKKGQYQNTPHWNRERRFIDITGAEKRVPSEKDHVLDDTSSLEISFVDDAGIERKQTIKRDYSNLCTE